MGDVADQLYTLPNRGDGRMDMPAQTFNFDWIGVVDSGCDHTVVPCVFNDRPDNNLSVAGGSHGTQVASVVEDNWGADPDFRVYQVVATGPPTGQAELVGTRQSLADALDEAGQNCPVVNCDPIMSGAWPPGDDNLVLTAIRNNPNSLYVFAAGQQGLLYNGTEQFPPSWTKTEPNCICITGRNQASGFITSPGPANVNQTDGAGSTVTAVEVGQSVPVRQIGGASRTANGSSYAAPRVTAELAVYRKANQALSAAQVRADWIANACVIDATYVGANSRRHVGFP